MYLGNINDYVIDNNRYLTRILLVTSKKAITRNWCKADPPTIKLWLGIVREIYNMEN